MTGYLLVYIGLKLPPIGDRSQLLYSRVGWWVNFEIFLHFQQKYPSDLLHTFQNYRIAKKNFWPCDLFIIDHDIFG
jgi:hypothetical protein